MIGILVQLAISWLVIWFFEKGNLGVLGLLPTRKRLIDFMIFFFLTAICCASDFFLRMYFARQRWTVNPDLSFNLLLSGTWWNIKSVIFEELIFRGVLLYILIKKLGASKAILISATGFGIYHWFSQEAFGNITQMAIIFTITGIMGLLYAYGYVKSFSLYIPCAIHLGWNITRSVIFSETVIGNQLFIPVKPIPEVTVSNPLFFFLLVFPMASALLTNYLVLKRRKQPEPLLQNNNNKSELITIK
jgi:membrane protease YdiL (CAAX protease family)